MGDFLDSLSFLSPEQRASLRADDLDTAVAFAHVTVSMLQAPPFGLTIGKASRLLAAAHGEAVAHGKVWPAATIAMRAHASTGAEMTDWQKKYLPEICMAVHMHHTGACDDLTNEQHASAVAYLETRVSRWNAHSNGRRWIGFDTQVLALCLSTLAEAREWMSERATMDAKCTTATIASEP